MLRAWIVSFLTLVLVGEPAAGRAPLGASLDAALAARDLKGARIAALVVRASDGAVLYEREPDRPLIPASNTKVLTALGALSAWGPSHRFVTEVRTDAALSASGEVLHLYVRGGGDPALTSEQWWRLAADLRTLGLTRVKGDLVLDDSLFDSVRWHPGWGPVGSRAYHAPVGALNANYGAFSVHVRPGDQPGSPLGVVVDPPVGTLQVVNRGQTTPRGQPNRLRVERQAQGVGREQVVVDGSLPVGSPVKVVPRSVADPLLYAGAVLRLQLHGVGIEVDGAIRPGVAPAGATVLHRFEGLTLAEVVQRFMKWSNNGIGETLLKGLAVRGGGAGTFAAGAAALRGELEALGLPLGSLTLVDGSGLSYDNRASPRLLVAALARARGSFDLAPEYLSALPIGGTDGTLTHRADGTGRRLRAKTGLLTRVSGLSGLVEGPDGEVVLFSVLVNGFRGSARGAMNALDAFASALAR